MATNDNPHALRMTAAIQRIAGDEAARHFASGHPLSRSADALCKYRWAQEICSELACTFDPETVCSIRRGCRCGDGKTMAQEISTCLARAGSLRDGCGLFTQKNRYAFLEYVRENELIFGYHACVCSCVKRAEGTLPLFWCECSAGYAEAMLRQVFGAGTQVELLASIKAGSRRCEMRISLP